MRLTKGPISGGRSAGRPGVPLQAETGGGFGGKEEYPSILAIHAALLARRIGRPVRMIYDRHEDIAATTKRHPAVVTHRTGVTRDGRLVAQDIEVVMDAGAYATLSPVVLSRGALHAGGPYRCPNVRIRARTMARNMPPSGAFRGFGAPETEFAAEMQVNGSPRRSAFRAEVEARTGLPFRESYRTDAREHGPSRADVRFVGYPGIEWDQATFRGDAYPCYSWAAAVAAVDVDLDTGEVAVRSVVAVDEAGRIVNPVLAAGQVEGGTLQAVGYATIEEMQVERGRYVNDRFATYLIPTALDAPEIRALFAEDPFAGVPHGAKGLGELPMDVGAPAVIAAIHDATGAWIHELPATPERVLAAILEAEEGVAPAAGVIPEPHR